jgi:hypothetical protein
MMSMATMSLRGDDEEDEIKVLKVLFKTKDTAQKQQKKKGSTMKALSQ